MTGRHGFTLVEVLVATTLAAVVLAAVTRTLAVGARHLVRLDAARAADDTTWGALESFTFDVRRAGYAPRSSGVEGITVAREDQCTITSDDDADGTIDVRSDEVASFVCDAPGRRILRQIGAQRMALASEVDRCEFAYHDAEGHRLTPGPGGLDAAARRTIQTIDLMLGLARPTGTPILQHAVVAVRRPR